MEAPLNPNLMISSKMKLVAKTTFFYQQLHQQPLLAHHLFWFHHQQAESQYIRAYQVHLNLISMNQLLMDEG